MANMTDKDTMIEMGLDSRQVLDGLKQVEKAAEGTAQKIGQEGDKASKGVEKIGDGAKGAAEKVDRGTKSIIASIERATAAAKAGERGTASYFEAIAQQRGVSSEALKPYLDQLRQAEAAQRKAEGSLQNMGVSAAQTAAALRQVPAQFTDIATSLAGGQAPLTVLLQQGGQLKDSFGGAGAAAQALGGYVIGLINPFTLAAAAAAAIGYGFFKGAEEAQAFNKALVLSGNAAGTTVGQLTAMAERLDGLGTTQAKAAESLTAFVNAGVKGADGLERYTLAAIRLEKVGGDSVEKTAKAFAELGNDPLRASVKLNESTNFLTKSVYEQIKALEEQGRATDAARVAQDAYADAINDRTPKILEQLGLIERKWLEIKDGAKEAGDALLSIGRQQSLSSRRDEAQNAINRAQSDIYDLKFGGGLPPGAFGESALRRELAIKQEIIDTNKILIQDIDTRLRREQQAAGIQSVNAQFLKDSIATEKELVALGVRKLSQKREEENLRQRLRSGGADDLEVEKAVAALREKNRDKKGATEYQRALEKEASLLEKVVGLSGSYYEDLNQRFSLYKSGKISVEEYRAAVEKLNSQQPIYKDQAEGLKKLREEAERTSKEWIEGQRAYDKWVESLRKGGDQVDAQVERLKDESKAAEIAAAKNISLAQAIEEVAIARLREKRDNSSSAEEIAAIDREIAKRRELIGLIGSKEAQEANKKAADNMQREFERVAGQIEQSLSDALMQGGKSAAEYLKGLFRQLVLRPLLQPLVQPIAGLIAGATGTGSMAASQGASVLSGSPMSALSSLSTGQNLVGFLSAGAGGSVAAGSALGIGNTFALGSQLATSGGSLVGLQTAGQLFGAGQYSAAAGMSAGVIAPWAAGIGIGYMGGRAISDGYAALGGSGNSAVSLGTIAGAFFSGPIGAALGGAIGGLVNRAFGRRAPEVESRELVGSFNGGDFAGNLQDNILEKGGLFRSDKRYSQTTALSSDLEKALDESGKQLADLAKKYGAALGLPVDQLASVNQTIRVKLTENAEEDSKAIEAALQQYSDALLKGFSGDLEPLRKSGETLAQTIERVGTSLLGVNESLQLLGLTALDTSVAGGAAATKLAEQFGGLSNLANLTGDYYQRYYYEAERAASATQTIAGELQKLGIAMPANREQFRALVEAQDLTTESGQKTFAALLSIAGVFDEVSAASERAAEKVKQEREALDQAITGTLPKFLSDMERQAFEYQRIATALAKQGVSVSVESLMSATKDEILDFARTFVSLDTNSNEAKLSIVNLAGALADLKDEALSFVKVGDRQFDAGAFSGVVAGITKQDILQSIQTSFTGPDLDRALSNFNVGSTAFFGAYANSLAAERLSPTERQFQNPAPVYGGMDSGASLIADAQRENTEALKRLTQTLQDDLQSLLVGDVSALSPEQQLKAARAEFDRLNAAAEAGDVEAAGQVGGAAREFLQLAQQFSPGQYPKVFDEILKEMRELLSAAQNGNQINVAGFGTVARAAQEGADATHAALDSAALERQRTVGLEL